MKHDIQNHFVRILESMGVEGVLPSVEVPEDAAHGDYTTNVAMVLFPKLPKPPKFPNPRIFANDLKDAIQKDQTLSNAGIIERVEVAGPGFINLYMSEAVFINQVSRVLKEQNAYGFAPNRGEIRNPKSEIRNIGSEKIEEKQEKNTTLQGGKNPTPPTSPNSPTPSIFPRKNAAVDYSARQNGTDQQVLSTEFIPEGPRKKVMVEFAHPNTHKAFHIGHLRNITTGESIVRLLESQGHTVIRANYQGDVGMHIAKALYALLEVSPYKDQVSEIQGVHERVEFLGKAYAAGSQAYESSDEIKKGIGEINKKIYAKDPSIYELYRETRQWSLDYFASVYARVGSHFDRLYFESETYESGKKNVLDGLKKGIFEESDGAIIFPGEKYGLHTRVFITKEGNATYEGKDMGLAPLQNAEHHPDLIIHVLGPEQFMYTRVMFQALDLLFPEDAGKQFHLVYGWVKLKHGKMSSRSGNVVLGEWLLDEAAKSIYTILEKSISEKYTKEQKDEIAEKSAVAAVKYSFLRVGISNEISFDLETSVSFDGDSGPYLQYTYARAKSVLRKAQNVSHLSTLIHLGNVEERALARAIMQFPDVVAAAAANFAPNTMCTYLFQLAQAFNTFYAKDPIVGNDMRIALTAACAQVLKNGLYLLGIDVLERM